METIKQRLRASLLSARLPEEEISRRAAELAGNLQPDGTWPDLAGLDPFAGDADGTPAHLQRTLLLAQANRGAGGPLGKPLRQALDSWLAHDFQAADWQQNQVVVPRLIASIALLVDDGLSPGARGKVTEILARSRWQHWVEGSGWVDWTGTLLLRTAHNALLRGCVCGMDAEFEESFARVFRAIRVAPEGEEGIQSDMIYRATPGQSNTGNDGLAYAADCIGFVALAHGTPWQAPAESTQLLANFLLEGQQWLMRNGVIAANSPESGAGHSPASLKDLSAAVERLVQFGDVPRRAEMAALARRLMGPEETLSGHRHFWRSGFSVHQRPAFYASVRLAPFTDPSHAAPSLDQAFADGMNCVMRSGAEYSDVATTPPRGSEMPGGVGEDDAPALTGGISEGDYGLAAMRVDRTGFSATKAWFYFDHSFVCLGAGITLTGSNQPVFSPVNQCRLNGPVAAVADLAKARVLAPGAEHTLPGIRRIVHDGITYHFARPSKLAVQAGAPVAAARFSLGVNLGLHPRDESYAYTVLPIGEDAAVKPKVDEEIAQIEILSNTPAIQAVRHRGLGLLGVSFWQAGMLVLPGGGRVAANQPCVLLCRDTKAGKRLSIANLKTQASTVHVEYAGKCVCFELPGGPDAGRGVSRSL